MLSPYQLHLDAKEVKDNDRDCLDDCSTLVRPSDRHLWCQGWFVRFIERRCHFKLMTLTVKHIKFPEYLKHELDWVN